MCGIAGALFWGRDAHASAAAAAVETMVTRLDHRGPDGRGVHVASRAGATDHAVVLGHARLAIIDTSSAGAQPMVNGSGEVSLTFNGEIYNFAELKEELSRGGVRFQSHSDTEVILRGYEVWGLEVVSRLRGMFAFALWDGAKQRLLIARDRLGIKPVYLYRANGVVLFASEVRALLATGLVPRHLDSTALWEYLGWQSVPAPRSLVAGVDAMGPASWITIDAGGGINTGVYWRMLDSTTVQSDVTPDQAYAAVGDALRDAVRAHMVSDVPVAAFLSGGIDSSAVVALMRESGATPRTFSVGFEEQEFDESSHAALVAQTFRAEHTHVPLSGSDLLARLPAALAAMDQPTGDAVYTYIGSGAVHDHGLKVALSGLGGDEVFGGYPSFSRILGVQPFAGLWGKAPSPVRQLAARTARAVTGESIASEKTAALLASNGTVAEMYPVMRQVLSAEQRRSLLSASVLATIAGNADPYTSLLAASFDASPDASVFSQISFAESRTYMHDVLLRDTDQMSMAHALEVRVPLLDHRLIELVVTMPDAVKQSKDTPKPLLVHALGKLLPESIVYRPKQGFSLPFAPWMRGPLREFCEQKLGDRGLAGRGLFKPDAIDALWRSFLDGHASVSWSRLWTLVVLETWLDRQAIDTSHVA